VSAIGLPTKLMDDVNYIIHEQKPEIKQQQQQQTRNISDKQQTNIQTNS